MGANRFFFAAAGLGLFSIGAIGGYTYETHFGGQVYREQPPSSHSVQAKFKILGIGNPLLDISAEVPASVLERYNLVQGSSILAAPEHVPLFKEVTDQYKVDYVAGGATQNSIRAAQWYSQSPGYTTFFGCVGDNDVSSQKLREVLLASGVFPHYQSTPKAPTGTCIALITGKERTLVANVAAAEQFTPDFLDSHWSVVEEAKIIYHEGFFLISSLESCLKLARYSSFNDNIYAVNVSSEFIAEHFRDALNQVLLHADFVFCNETEALKYAQVNGIDTTDVMEIARRVASLPKQGTKPRTMVITQGSRNTIVGTPMGVQSFPVPRLDRALIVDTNGAGDSFVGGFLAELAKGSSIDKCVAAGQYVAREVIQHKGCSFPSFPTYPSANP
jgi:adenosine kinase